MKNTKKFFFLGLIVAVIAVACEKPPTEAMDKAAAAVTRVENDIDVQVYASNNIAKIRDMLKNMRTEANQKRYAQARQLAADIIDFADKVIAEGKSAAARLHDDAANALDLMENAIRETQTTLEDARKAKQQGLKFDELDNDFTGAQSGAEQARLENNEKRYREAIDTSEGVRSALGSITAKIGEASLSQSRKK
ncbi:MAG: hypothetical protein LBV68_09175 [Spirochaetaceae bacterium]|jgi:hypothetical protein|nr:hypothetical protein [Spirochaetaceae bacterium]